MSHSHGLLLLWHVGLIQQSVSDSGAGTDAVITTATTSVQDSGAGTDTAAYAQVMPVTDSGAGTDSTAIAQLMPVTDSGAGTDSTLPVVASTTVQESGAGTDAIASAQAQTAQTDSGAGTDALNPAPQAQTSVSDSGAGTETLQGQGSATITDSGAGSDIVIYGPLLTISDSALGIDITYLTQGQISLDGASLPHVQSIGVDEPSILQDLPVMDALPYRRQIGKKGRSLKIQGWTDSLATLEILREYADGQKHLLLLPTGDSMYVLISDVQTPETPANYTRFEYTITAVEVID